MLTWRGCSSRKQLRERADNFDLGAANGPGAEGDEVEIHSARKRTGQPIEEDAERLAGAEVAAQVGYELTAAPGCFDRSSLPFGGHGRTNDR